MYQNKLIQAAQALALVMSLSLIAACAKKDDGPTVVAQPAPVPPPVIQPQNQPVRTVPATQAPTVPTTTRDFRDIEAEARRSRAAHDERVSRRKERTGESEKKSQSKEEQSRDNGQNKVSTGTANDGLDQALENKLQVGISEEVKKRNLELAQRISNLDVIVRNGKQLDLSFDLAINGDATLEAAKSSKVNLTGLIDVKSNYIHLTNAVQNSELDIKATARCMDQDETMCLVLAIQIYVGKDDQAATAFATYRRTSALISARINSETELSEDLKDLKERIQETSNKDKQSKSGLKHVIVESAQVIQGRGYARFILVGHDNEVLAVNAELNQINKDVPLMNVPLKSEKQFLHLNGMLSSGSVKYDWMQSNLQGRLIAALEGKDFIIELSTGSKSVMTITMKRAHPRIKALE